ncbi:MAG: hypothetical protein JWN15_2496 [Firmicutes bacterium]|nr:hypothetical protein [Bacillota bacterium]
MMERSADQIMNRLDALVDGWRRASPSERLWMVVEKIRLERELDELTQQAPGERRAGVAGQG